MTQLKDEYINKTENPFSLQDDEIIDKMYKSLFKNT